ncbi:ParB and winged helix-turn-helix domain-containing protein [Crossiella sp. NPDC003009]
MLVPLGDLRIGTDVRQGGADSAHVRLLAESTEPFPPIVVRRASMRVVDGVHRLQAARLRGTTDIAVRFFDGDEHESFVLAVRLNVRHGLPLSLADRIAAATRIMALYPHWSDRAIGVATGLSGKTVGKIRHRSTAEVPQSATRIGQDGRARPVNAVQGRLQASRLLTENPDTSLRAVAKAAGISPSTVLDVRNRLRRGEDPVPAPRERPNGKRPAADREPGAGHPRFRHPRSARSAGIRQSLRQDPALRFTESGRNLLRWLDTQAVDPQRWAGIADSVPTHCAPVVAELARQTADAWLKLAQHLDQSRPGA